jgi:outer membrane protein assembly factor BamE (lipoprotein component of BamABCDE complex)
MKLTALLVSIIAVGLAGCSTPSSRIDHNPAAFAQLTPQQQNLVREGKVAVGMSANAVKLALGDPDRVALRTDASGQVQIWHYVTYGDNGIPLYTGYYHRGWRNGLGYGDGWGLLSLLP